MSDSGVGEEDSGQAEKKLKLDPDNLQPHLQCAKCQDFFRVQVFGCSNNHTTCALCCGVDIKCSMEIIGNVVCPVEECKIMTRDSIQ